MRLKGLIFARLAVGRRVQFKANRADKTGGTVVEIRTDPGKVPTYGVLWDDGHDQADLHWYYKWELKPER